MKYAVSFTFWQFVQMCQDTSEHHRKYIRALHKCKCNFLSSLIQGLGLLTIKAQIQNLVCFSTYSEVKQSISVKITGNINNFKLITNLFHL